MTVFAWLCVAGAFILFLVFLTDQEYLYAFESLLAGGISFVCWKGTAILVAAAETYLSNFYPSDSEDAFSDEDDDE